METKDLKVGSAVVAPAVTTEQKTEVILEKGADPVIASTVEQLEAHVAHLQGIVDVHEKEKANATPAPSINTATSLMVSNSATVMDMQDVSKYDSSLVKVKISYPKDFTGGKFLKEGAVYPVSKETADQFVTDGIGKIVK